MRKGSSLLYWWTALKRVLRAVPYLGTPLFDRAHYRHSNPGFFARLFPWTHFVVAGAFRDRNPHPLFDTAFYVREFPEVAAIRANPLFHYIKHGSSERRRPHPLFDPHYYLSRRLDAGLAGTDPLTHFLQQRGLNCPEPSPQFDCQFYVRHHPGAETMNPLLHYVSRRAPEAGTRPILLHYHFFKNAGTTIEGILTRCLGAAYRQIDSPDRNGLLTQGEVMALLQANPSLQAVSSHQFRYPLFEAPGFTFFDMCFLRRPLDRIRSMYDYFREYPDSIDPISNLANAFPLGEFLARLIEHYPEAINDVQVRLLSGSPSRSAPDAQDLELATLTMLKVAFLGVVDCFDESLVAGQHFLRPVFPRLDCDYVPVNVTNGLNGLAEARVQHLHEICGDRVYDELLRLNALDRELVARARNEVMRRLRIVPDHAARLQLLKENVEWNTAARSAASGA